MPQTHTSAGYPPCDPELIAAYIEDGLEGAERDRVEKLVADAPAWREVYLESLELAAVLDDSLDDGSTDFVVAGEPSLARASRETHLEETDSTLAFPSREAQTREGRGPRIANAAWLAAAASLVILGLTAPYWLRMLDPVADSERLLARAVPEERWGAIPPDWQMESWSGPRGGGASNITDPKTHFQVGVLVTKLALANELGSDTQLQTAAQRVFFALNESDDPETVLALLDIQPLFEPLRAADSDAQQRREAASEITQRLEERFGPSALFRLGQWSWSSLLAAQVRNQDYFATRTWRRGLEEAQSLPLQEDAAMALAELVTPALTARRAEQPLTKLIFELGSWNTGVLRDEAAP